MLRIFLVVPCYNEAERLDLQAFRNARLKRHRLEFVFVDDGSKTVLVAFSTGFGANAQKRSTSSRTIRTRARPRQSAAA